MAEAEAETRPDATVRPVQFSPLSGIAGGKAANPESLDILMDVPLHVSVELGRTRMPVKEVLSLQHGSVVELDRMAGEPVDVLVNDRLIARGEVVVIEDRFGIRITETISQMRRYPTEE
jgi:flagellar motor switch protein FliN/FliY